MPACSFCKKNYENPRGLTIFTFDGKSIFYCSSKCRNNAKLGRDPKKTNWVKSVKKVKEIVLEKPKKEEEKVEVKEEKVEEKKTEAKKEKIEEKKEVKEKVE